MIFMLPWVNNTTSKVNLFMKSPNKKTQNKQKPQQMDKKKKKKRDVEVLSCNILEGIFLISLCL